MLLLHHTLHLQSTGQWMTCRYFQDSSGAAHSVSALRKRDEGRPNCISRLIFSDGDISTIVLSNYFIFPCIYFWVGFLESFD